MKKVGLSEKVIEELKKRNLWEQDEDEKEEKEESDDDEPKDSNEGFCEMVCQLLHSQTQVHIFHLGTKSYAEHKALQGYYESIDGIVDGIIESYQGQYGLLTDYKSYKNETYKNKKQVLKYFMGLLDTIDEKRESVDDSYLQNQIDTVEELIYSTMYKLRFLN
jgi:hypothetical protein